MNFYDHLFLIDALTKLCRKVGLYICHCYENSNSERSMTKKDGTPLTQVDLNAHSMLLTGLYSICPDIPVLSEESTDKELENRLDWKRLWLVDPLDGTREFLNKTGEFTINLALVELGRPILGIIYQPLQQVCYAGVVGEGVWRICGGDLIRNSLEIENRSATKKTISILSSRGNRGLVFDDYLDWLDRNFIKFNLLKFGAALKFIKLVDGVGDVYPRFSPCSEWDVAAGDAIVHAAGGMLVGLDGLPLKYNFRKNLISEPFIAVKDSSNSIQSKSIDFFCNYTS